jgi:peptide/nickel transport system permease protein
VAILAGRLHRALDSDIWHSFKNSKVTIGASIVVFVIFVIAILAPAISPQNPLDATTYTLLDADKAPGYANKQMTFLLGTDDQGRDLMSNIFYGTRISLLVGFVSVLLAMTLGITLGLISGYAGGFVDAFIMRVADIQLTFPAILVALLIDGVARSYLTGPKHEELAFFVLVFSIGLSFWVQYARTVRGSVLVEKGKEYVLAARVIGLRPVVILFRHILPNVMGPVLVIATINLALAIITEATLSFLGVGLPATQPSLGRLIQDGNKLIFAGEWWAVIFPSIALVLLVLAVNLLGDWLRDALNPKLR